MWRGLPLLVVLVAVAVIFATDLNRTLSFESFLRYQQQLRHLVSAHLLEMLGLYMLLYVAAVTLSMPVSAFLTTIGGYLFGWLLGGAAAIMAATLGATGIFLIARTSIGRPLLRRTSPRIQGFAAGFQREAFSYLLCLRLLPVVPFWLTNLAAALFAVPLRTFVLATQIGMIPASFAFAMVGAGLDDVLAKQDKIRAQCIAAGGTDCAISLKAKSLLTPELSVAFVSLGMLALAPILVRYWQGRRFKGDRA
ncbi:TVP38/TMEM64 family protein [Microvirga alba]|uniref:TVP38/TMEM64 family protein n=1 Tax=Microvirga alba TaxID=2791025 RepID=UPI002D21C9C7|nr:VTT domain-containing protein [Microvirga alba]